MQISLPHIFILFQLTMTSGLLSNYGVTYLGSNYPAQTVFIDHVNALKWGSIYLRGLHGSNFPVPIQCTIQITRNFCRIFVNAQMNA